MNNVEVQTPAYVIDESILIQNLKILKELQIQTQCKILLAQKCFSMFYFYPLIEKYLRGTTASGLNEARLAKEYFKGENHIYSPAYKANEIEEIAKICEHIVFNSMKQVEKYAEVAKKYKREIGIRINPEHSTQEHEIYDPCNKSSRLGIRIKELKKAKKELIKKIDGIHMHTLCEQNSDALEETVKVMEEKFGEYLKQMKWINLGGGHHITKEGYDIERLKKIIRRMQKEYELEVYLEPGEAIALNAGKLEATVEEIQEENEGVRNVIIDASAACHMPDVLEMPYIPEVEGAKEGGKYKCRIGSMTCLAGDVIGEYSFEEELKEGDRIIFKDMAIYTMVKNNTFNGMGLPSIYVKKENGEIKLIKSFGYEDFKNRLS